MWTPSSTIAIFGSAARYHHQRHKYNKKHDLCSSHTFRLIFHAMIVPAGETQTCLAFYNERSLSSHNYYSANLAKCFHIQSKIKGKYLPEEKKTYKNTQNTPHEATAEKLQQISNTFLSFFTIIIYFLPIFEINFEDNLHSP